MRQDLDERSVHLLCGVIVVVEAERRAVVIVSSSFVDESCQSVLLVPGPVACSIDR
jgi:hypothetical protein